MTNCEINIENGIPVVKTYPSLMQDILEYTGFNVDRALDLYGAVLTDEFQELNIQNPTLKNVTSFIEQDSIDNAKKLSAQDRQNLLNISLQPTYMEDIKDRFINAFNVDGEFGIDISKIVASGLFTNSDVLEMSSKENINKLKQLYYKLNNTDEQFESITSNINVKNNLFSKLNPDEFIQNSYDFYIGSQTEQDVINKANEIGDDLILENNSLASIVLDLVKNKQSFVQYEGNLLTGTVGRKETNNTETKLVQTLDTNQDYSSLLSQIDFIRSRPINAYVEDYYLVNNFLYNLENQAADLGVDISGLATISEDSTYDEIVDYLDSLYNFLSDVNDSKIEANREDTIRSMQETIPVYAESYNNFFGISPEFKNAVSEKVNRNGVFLHLETNESQEDLFKTNSIIKVRDNIYQKITDDNTLEDLYNLLFANPSLLPNGVLTIKPTEVNRDLVYEEIDQYVSQLAANHLTETSDSEALKKMITYQLLNNIREVNTPITVNGLDNLDISKFLIDFNKLALKNPKVQNLFYFSNRGLEANQVVGEFTARDIKNSISERDFDNLVLYSKLSGNESLSYFTNFNNDISPENMRDYYANNLSQLPAFYGKYYNRGGYVVADSNLDYLKIKNGLYERVAPNVYAEVQRNSRYLNYNLSKPTYDNSVDPQIQGQQSQRIRVRKMNNINDETIEFC